jgi:hypothetical protein
VYSKTLTGSDMRSLNPSVLPGFVDGGGVGATDNSGADYTGNNYFEAPLDLPTGAKLTSVAISYAGDFPPSGAGTYSVGSYAPATLATQPVRTIEPADAGSVKTVTRTGNPILTVAANRRYVLDWHYPNVVIGNGSPGAGVFYGAVIKYTCAAPCAP